MFPVVEQETTRKEANSNSSVGKYNHSAKIPERPEIHERKTTAQTNPAETSMVEYRCSARVLCIAMPSSPSHAMNRRAIPDQLTLR